jgi:hypothetical protein
MVLGKTGSRLWDDDNKWAAGNLGAIPSDLFPRCTSRNLCIKVSLLSKKTYSGTSIRYHQMTQGDILVGINSSQAGTWWLATLPGLETRCASSLHHRLIGARRVSNFFEQYNTNYIIQARNYFLIIRTLPRYVWMVQQNHDDQFASLLRK